MSVSSYRELGRTVEQEIGKPALAVRRFVAILDDGAITGGTDTQPIVNALGLATWGTPHPDLSILKLRKVKIAEHFGDSPYNVEVIAEYGIVTDNEALEPLSRTAEWAFETVSGSQVPALFYYDGSGNSTLYPLTNSAYDYFEGLTVDEAMVQATIKKNYQYRPDSQITSSGFLNDGTFLGSTAHSWKHAGTSVEYIAETFNNAIYKYWQGTSKLIFRPTGWDLQLPDVGYNFIGDGQKRRCMVFDFNNAEWVPSAGPVGLDGSGNQTGGRPAILVRRVNPEADFSSLFGNPPA